MHFKYKNRPSKGGQKLTNSHYQKLLTDYQAQLMTAVTGDQGKLTFTSEWTQQARVEVQALLDQSTGIPAH